MSFCLSLICFCFYCVCFYLFLFCVLLCCDLPAGKKLFKNVDIFRSFSPSASLSLSVASPATDELRALCPDVAISFTLFCFFLLHYTTQTFTHTHALDYFAFGPFELFAFACVFVFAPQQTVFLLLFRVFVSCSRFFLSLFLLRTFYVAVLRFFLFVCVFFCFSFLLIYFIENLRNENLNNTYNSRLTAKFHITHFSHRIFDC